MFQKNRSLSNGEAPLYGIAPELGDLMSYRGQVGIVVAVTPEDVQLGFEDGQAVCYWLDEPDLKWIGQPLKAQSTHRAESVNKAA